MAVVETRMSVWEALAGRAPGQPVGPADPGLWAAIVDRLNPARAMPRLRAGIEQAELTSVRGVPYVMLRSPDGDASTCYLRLTPEEARLAGLMDGSRTVARLVAEFARISGRLAPDQVTRVVADLAGNRMLAELPVDAFHRLDRHHRRPLPVRLGRGLLATARGQRVALANIDPLVSLLYRAGGRLLFTRPAAVLLGLVVLAGLALFGWTWWRADQSVFLTNGSYALGAAVLLGLNIVALACHELGHALATKHAGRRVPAAGFLVYFGIPSVFVDTTDVWMAGRRARMLTTMAGPAAGLILAGAAQLVGLAVPELAPWTFKLAFAWYLNALFNLNPFLALDGYYLLMDWLEVPNLRARGLAFVSARLRRRPPRWADLDREGRLIALYGTLAVLWLAIAVNLAYRIYSDRVSGLVTGLWRSGWPAQLLLVAVIVGLAAPMVYALIGWLLRRGRIVRARWAERRHDRDAPRRVDALRGTALGRLPEAALQRLAGPARWVRPSTGEQLVFAGAAQSSVYVVVDGALEGRRPGDPGGTIRERVGGGGLVGLASALTGAPAALAWHTAGTTLLSIPSAAVAAAVGPLAGPPPAERAELEELLAAAPAVAGLSTEDRIGLVARAAPEVLQPGEPVRLLGADDAVVVASGRISLGDGNDHGRGTTIGPAGTEFAEPVAYARTPVRLWRLPEVYRLPGLIGAGLLAGAGTGAAVPDFAAGRSGVALGPGQRPRSGAHPPTGYPPLAAPPGPPPPVDEATDRRFERAMWWLVVLLLLLALLLTGANLFPGAAWAEMRADRALLTVTRGSAVVVEGDRRTVLSRGDDVYLGQGARVSVLDRSTAELTFRGGAVSVLCARSRLDLGPLWTEPGAPQAPSAQVELVRGRMLNDTSNTSRAFAPLALDVLNHGRHTRNAGDAWYAVAYGGAEVSVGTVEQDGTRLAPHGRPLGCGADERVVDPPDGTPSPEPTPAPSPTPGPSVTPTPSPSASPTPSPSRSRSRSPRPPSPSTTTQGPPPTTAPPPDRTDPVISAFRVAPSLLAQIPPRGFACGGQQAKDTTASVLAIAADPPNLVSSLTVTFRWTLQTDGTTDTGGMQLSDGQFLGGFSIAYAATHLAGGSITVELTVRDKAGNVSTAETKLTLDVCRLIQIPG